MLIRQGGGYDNIKEYLENGLKQGSYVHRDVKDKRIVLDGDLDIVNQFIQSFETNGERYSHFTASFKEDEVSINDLDYVTQELKEFFGAAFQEDEFQFYAEAHLPKIKTYIDNKTGKEITRKPHIHIIIPKRNVIDGSYVNPMGYYKNNVKYIEAIQERLNIDINSESPKDNRRTDLSDASDIISRYKGDVFKSDPRRLKEKLLNNIVNDNIQSWEVFLELASGYGDITYRNKGRENEYVNIKEMGAAKGVNLKEPVFTRGFIELTNLEKLQRIANGQFSGKVRNKSEERKSYDNLVKEWKDKRCHEIRYMNPNSKAWKEYCKKTPKEKKEVIAGYIRESHRQSASVKTNIFGMQEHPAELLKKLITEDDHDNQVSLESIKPNRGKQPRLPPERRDRVYTVSERSLDGDAEWRAESILQDEVRLGMADEGEAETGGRHNSVRWDVHGIDEDLALDQSTSADGTAESYLNQLYEARAQYEQAKQVDWKVLQNSLDLDELLNSLSQTHGIDRNAYTVTESKSGDARVQCGTRRYSPSDFLTKVINLDWVEAQGVLLEASKRQGSDTHTKQRESKAERKFWAEFRSWQYTPGNTYKEHWAKQRDNERQRFKDIRQRFKDEKSWHFAWNASPAERSASMSILRLKKIAEEDELRALIKKERQAFKTAMAIEERYKEFLRSKILSGDQDALEEYRRFVQTLQQKKALATFETPDAKNALLTEYTFEVNRDGSVIYFLNEVKMITDSRDWVTVEQEENQEAIEMALRLTLDKFYGKPIILTGSEEFKKRVADVAAKRNLKVRFDEPELQKYYERQLSSVSNADEYAKGEQMEGSRAKRRKPTFKP